MKEKTIFREFVGDNPTTRVLEHLIEGRFFDYTLTDICEGAEVSWRSLNRIWPNFIKNEIVIVNRVIGRIKLYKLNVENPSVIKLIDLFDYLLKSSLEKVSLSSKEKVVV